MKLTKWMAATALFLSFGVAGCTDDITDEVSQLTRNTDEVSVAYNKDATARISVRVPGAWSASVACKDAAGQETAAWLRLDPAEGVGNGKDYQWITAIADRNLGGEREAVITIVGATRGDAVEVKVTQDDGTFTVKKPVLSGDLKANVGSNALLAVEYDKAKGGEPVKKGRIVIATVKGDIHDIGKNIVRTVLENYGYDVLDLGRDVPPETVVDAVVKENIRLVGLSALMTTTLPSMEETVRQLHTLPNPPSIMVGGAVVTPEYAQNMGAFYAKDARASVEIAKKVLG